MALQRHHIDELAELPEDRALELHLSEIGWGRLAIWMRFSVFAVFAWAVAASEEGTATLRFLWPALAAVLVVGFFVWRRFGLESKPFLRWGYPLVLAQMVAARLAYAGSGEVEPFDFMLPGLLMIFPLPLAYQATLSGLFWLPLVFEAGILDVFTGSATQPAIWIPYTVYIGFLLLFSRFLYRRRVGAFLEAWQRARRRALEGLRMRDELDQARRIQLSMLPQHDPYSAWLDIAGGSQPATEVGGDYYGYFELGPGRQAVVVADVAGHGVASGLLLAGVRGCLVLLHDGGDPVELEAPAAILGRLDRVVRTVGGRRTFVTMVYTLFDRQEGRLTLAAAGHPPLLRWRPDGTIEEIALPSLPLGTALGRHSFPEDSRRFAPGDVFVFATDGIAEAVDPAGVIFGEERLHAAIRRVAPGATAAEIRDALLEELARFLGEGEVQDDVTLVVVRVKS